MAAVLEDKSTTNWKFKVLKCDDNVCMRILISLKVIAVAQALWLLKSATGAIAAGEVEPEVQQYVTTIVRWLVVSAGGDSPPLRSIAYLYVLIYLFNLL